MVYNEKRDIYNLYYLATNIYHKELTKHPEVLKYIYGRHITNSTLKDYQVGYAPGHNVLLRAVKKYHFAGKSLRDSGLFTFNEHGHFDKFYHRIMFPISDYKGHTVAFSGRKMPNSKSKSKYMVSPNSIIYKKSHSVMGLKPAMKRIRQKKTVIIVEGNFDAMSLHQSGIHNVVATLGCNITEPQVKFFCRIANRIFLCYDGDLPGRAGICRAIRMFLPYHRLLYAVRWQSGIDPADLYCAEQAPGVKKRFLSRNMPAIQFLIDCEFLKLLKYNDGGLRLERFTNYSTKIIKSYTVSAARNDWMNLLKGLAECISQDKAYDAVLKFYGINKNN